MDRRPQQQQQQTFFFCFSGFDQTLLLVKLNQLTHRLLDLSRKISFNELKRHYIIC